MKIDRKPTPQDVTWFLDMNNANKLDLEPVYQRKSVWNNTDREFFLDTVVNNFPCPPIFIHKDIDKDGNVKYRVIDGKQRLLTIISYAQDKFAVSHNDDNHPLSGKLFSEISPEYKKAFWNYTFPVEMINEENKDVLKGIFDRLNRNNKALNPQELRKARFEGQLQKFIETESNDPYWSELVRFTKNDISRMIDHQFICEIVLLISNGKINGFEQSDLDQIYADNDLEFEKEAYVADVLKQFKSFFTEINKSDNVLKEHFFTRSSVYTLWATFLPHLKALPSATDIAKKLKEFADQLEKDGEASGNEDVSQYAVYNKGATTDRTPREKRTYHLTKYLDLK